MNNNNHHQQQQQRHRVLQQIIANKFKSATGTQRSARVLYWLLAGGGAVVVAWLCRVVIRKLRPSDPWSQIMDNKTAGDRELKQKLNSRKMPDENQWDVAIVGAGPAGATAAYYLASRYALRVLLLERYTFPRDKICGDVFPADTRRHLRAMGILDDLIREKHVNYLQTERYQTPRTSFDHRITGIPQRSLSIRRTTVDERIAQAAVQAGADLREGHLVTRVRFSPVDRMFTIYAEQQQENMAIQHQFEARMLICADGAASSMAKLLRIVRDDSNAVASRAYITQHQFGASSGGAVDGVHLSGPRGMISPGHVKLTRMGREDSSDMVMNTFIVPGGRATASDITSLHQQFLTEESLNVKPLIGPNATTDEQLQVMEMRVNGVAKSYKDHTLVIGEAAGMTNAATGYGLHYAMDSAELAAKVIAYAIAHNCTDETFLKQYHTAWQARIGRQMHNSAKTSRLHARYPSLLDATISLAKNRSDRFKEHYVQLLHGQRSVWWYLRPDIVLLLVWEFVRLWFSRNKK